MDKRTKLDDEQEDQIFTIGGPKRKSPLRGRLPFFFPHSPLFGGSDHSRRCADDFPSLPHSPLRTDAAVRRQSARRQGQRFGLTVRREASDGSLPQLTQSLDETGRLDNGQLEERAHRIAHRALITSESR